MKKISFVGLLIAVMAFIIPQNAFAQEEGKWYRLKNVNNGNYMTFTSYTSLTDAATDNNPARNNSGLGIAALDATSEAQIFKFEPVGNKYYMVSKSGYYIYCAYWQCHASQSQKTQITVEKSGNNYALYQSESSDGSNTYPGYIAPQSTGTGIKIYCDNKSGGSGYNYRYWILEEYAEALSERTITVEANNAEWGTVTGGATSNEDITITATPNAGYQFEGWYLNGDLLTNDLSYTDRTNGDKTYVAHFAEKVYCATTANQSNSGNGAGRYLRGFTLSDGTSSIEVTDIQTTENSKIYSDKTSYILTTSPGATLSISAVDIVRPEWMHAYVFVDYDKDKEFNQTTNSDGTTGGEVVSFNYYNGKNSKNQSGISNNCQVLASNIPTWTLPENLSGEYRLRFKIDWNSVDACGAYDIAANNGCIVDVTIVVATGTPARQISVSASPAEGGVATVNGEAGPVTADGIITLNAVANDGYKFVEWTLNGATYSSNATCVDNAEGDKEYVAVFTLKTVEDKYNENVCKPTFNSTGNTSFVSGASITNGIGIDNGAIEIGDLAVKGQQGVTAKISANAGATFNLNLTYVRNWGDIEIYNIYGTASTRVYGPYEGSWDTSSNPFIDMADKGITVDGTTATFPIEIPQTLQIGDYFVVRSLVGSDAGNACATGINEGGYIDFLFEITGGYVAPSYVVTVSANDETMGSVSKSMTDVDVYSLKATANEGYEFVNWTVAGEEVSAEATFTYTATADAEVVANFQATQEWPATMTLIATAEALAENNGVGYPNAETKAAFQAIINNAKANSTIDKVEILETAIEEYYNATEIELPVAGKTYAFVMALTESDLYYIYNNGGTLALASYTGELPESAYFTCGMDGDKYTFQSVVDNKYMAIPQPVVSWLVESTVSVSGLETTVTEVAKFEVKKLAAGMNEHVQADAETLFGMAYFFGSRGTRTDNGAQEPGVIIMNNTPGFDKSNNPMAKSGFSSVVKFVEVSYTPVYSVSAEAYPANAGEVAISAEEVEENGTVDLSATAATGYNFVNWTVNGEVVSTEESFESAAIVANTTFVANFAKKTYNVTVNATEGGYVTTSEFTSPVEYGTEITIEATANEGYEFVMWLIDGEAGPNVNPWTFQVTTPLAMTAQFQAKNYTITYIVDGGSYKTETYAYGATVTPIAEPTKEGYTFSGWSAIPETMPAENVTVTGTFTEIIKEDVVVTDENKEENANAMYANVTVANEKVWDIKANTISADKVSVSVSATGVAPQIKIADGGEVTAVLEVNRVVKKGEWAMMALPFAVDLANVTVDGVAAQDGVNIKVMVYDAAKRANESIELWTKSGWVDLQGTTIAANQGFAVAVNAQNGDEQTVTFVAAVQTYDGSDKEVALDRHASTVNEGADADWNFFGNPTLANAEKGTGYALYIYNAEDDSYDEYASSDAVTSQPYAAMFAQSADDFNSLNFSAGTAGALADANGVYGEMQFSLNGEDEARVVLSDEASAEYVRNEDALYFAAPNANLAQLYIVKGKIKMAVSEQPEISETIALGYKAAKAGEQTLTLTSLPDNTNIILKDNVTGDEVALTVGDSYTFESAAGTFNNRFVVTTTDLTGIAQTTTGEVKVVVNGNDINVYGAEAGAEVVAYTTNGVVVASAVAEEGVTTISTSANGVIIVKVADVAVKVIK